MTSSPRRVLPIGIQSFARIRQGNHYAVPDAVTVGEHLPDVTVPFLSWPLPLLILFTLGWVAVAGLLILAIGLRRVFGSAPRLGPGQLPEAGVGRLTVVVPAYNESVNIGDCMTAILASAEPGLDWQLLVVDDESTDDTLQKAGAAAADHPRVQVLSAGPRPQGETWVGKNWACDQGWQWLCRRGREQGRDTAADWILFVDADVRLEPGTLGAALTEAIATRSDLLSLAPRLECSCLAEWLVQPIVASLLGLGFPMTQANDPDHPTAFAAGPFMLFRQCSYEALGGHRAVAAEVVEDLALARLVKGRGDRLRYLLGLDWARLQMYRDFPSLWEGWTKNWFLGLDRDPLRTLASGAVVVLMFSLPWLLLPLGAVWPLLLAPALAGIALQWSIRRWSAVSFNVPMTYWWLAGLGGLIIGAIAPVSMVRTLTGRNWTWRGRSLA